MRHSSHLFLRGGEEMGLETEFCKESETQTPAQGFQTTSAWLPVAGVQEMRVPLLQGAGQSVGCEQPGLLLEISPIVPRSGTGAKSSSCNPRAAQRKPPLEQTSSHGPCSTMTQQNSPSATA